MVIDNGEATKFTPEVQKQIDQAKNLLTITEQETKRLAILAKDQESVIRGLLEEKSRRDVDLETVLKDIEQANIQLKHLAATCSDRQAQSEQIAQEIRDSLVLVDKINASKRAIKEIISNLE